MNTQELRETRVDTALRYVGPRPAKDAPRWMSDLVAFRRIDQFGAVEVFTTDGSRIVRVEHLEPATYDDEADFHITPGALAAECAMSRDFNHFASPESLQADYEKHGNAWPFSGDHLGAQHVREEVYTPGVGVEPGDVIGRVRVRTATGVLWSRIAVG
ncbi:hypothetical protein SEA_DELAGARZA_59 [Microbacterium phage DelaGarza]|nr:hypothetical protein SEA_DELAGARZA_59 [Microbacterium phage DelaGarza]